ncbi:alpha-amylase family glycosyl hydrolase [Streptomyces sp. NBC_00151]|uniref:alpha-amylase family glycosyl hydrolase n=1 Tax=Streptomyces sp. NBC_00151 TaxID=2975669 RepID=UPI002DD94290|nr:alpha-amylase family glycosyl hydrolase [Streptomyces sp. NBC_00151]WRZ43500.1 alpha-amylase family glycosyl hydrolase [Streptomyces sp. NBC_00151]
MTSFRPAPAWLADAVFYQIYPQSFADSNGDGIGDFAGITERLDHLAWLGVNTVWLNPCFVSPFGDAGYDVADYLRVAPRYGSYDDLARLVDEAGRRDIRVLLDLVAGHTSDQHPWFRAAMDDPADDRYIWAPEGRLPDGFAPSPGTRPGAYLPNFFAFQPALNFGYGRARPDEPWRLPVDAPGPRANRAALRTVMDYWLGLGLAGFRVDMAASLVKDDPDKRETAAVWTELRHWLDGAHPEAVLLSEWGEPEVSVPAGFHADFFLQFGGPTDGLALRSLWSNGEGTVNEAWDPLDCFFDAEGRGSPRPFLEAWRDAAGALGEHGFIALPTANHDFSRLNCGPRTAGQLPVAFVFQLTWPTLPAIYYGDEIGMRYVPGLPEKEGSVLGPRYNRAGSRTPMQWDEGPNAGFSTAPSDLLYLPLDPSPDRPTVAAQRADDTSLLHLVRRLVALRTGTPELGPTGSVEVVHAGYPFVYVRGGRYLVVVNPRREQASCPAEWATGLRSLESDGVGIDAGTVSARGFGYGVFELADARRGS